MIVVDRDGMIEAYRQAARDILGHDGTAMAGRPVGPLVEGGWDAVRAIADSGGAQAARMIAADGDIVPVALSVGCLPGDDRSGYALFFVDSWEPHVAEVRRNRFERAARSVAMADFAAHMMHELNQPLAAANNFLAVAQKLVSRPDAGADVGEIIDMALTQVQRLGDIVRSTYRMAAGHGMTPRSISVRDAIAQAVTLVQVAAPPGAAAIVVDVRPQAMKMFVDPTAMQQVLTNLLRNAVEAFGQTSREDARIDVTARRTGGRIILSVADNGPGIAATTMPGLFDVVGHRDGKGGMGLGLSICRTIVEGHAGILTAENRSGGGACFTITLAPRRRTRPA